MRVNRSSKQRHSETGIAEELAPEVAGDMDQEEVPMGLFVGGETPLETRAATEADVVTGGEEIEDVYQTSKLPQHLADEGDIRLPIHSTTRGHEIEQCVLARRKHVRHIQDRCRLKNPAKAACATATLEAEGLLEEEDKAYFSDENGHLDSH